MLYVHTSIRHPSVAITEVLVIVRHLGTNSMILDASGVPIVSHRTRECCPTCSVSTARRNLLSLEQMPVTCFVGFEITCSVTKFQKHSWGLCSRLLMYATVLVVAAQTRGALTVTI